MYFFDLHRPDVRAAARWTGFSVIHRLRFENGWLAIFSTDENDRQSTPIHDVGGDVLDVHPARDVGAVIAKYSRGAGSTVGVAVCNGIDAPMCDVLSIGVWCAV